MKVNSIVFIFAAGLSSLAMAANESSSLNKANDAELTQALNKYLATQGDLCVGKFDWPIDVTIDEAQAMNTRDAVQMPVLEKLGLVTTTDSMTTRLIDEKEVTLTATRYTLTEKGRKYYLSKQSTSLAAGKQIVHAHDLCAGKLSLDKITRFDFDTISDTSNTGSDKQKAGSDNLKPVEVTVSYTYKIAPAEWATKPEVQQVFPLVAQVIKGQGTLQLQQVFHRTDNSWEAVNPWK